VAKNSNKMKNKNETD